MAFSLILGGISILVSTYCLEFDESESKSDSKNNDFYATIAIISSFFGKFLIAGSFAIIYNLTAELYPTSLRSTAIGTGSMAARVAGMLCPFVLNLETYASYLPGLVFGTISIVAGFLGARLPETLYQPMLINLDQAKIFYDEKF